MGRVTEGRLELKGVGYRVEHTENVWRFRFSGDFQPAPLVYSAKGHMLLGADVIRSCEIMIRQL